MARTVFFVSVPNGRGASLVTVPGQMLTSRTPLRGDWLTHGCEGVRRGFPTGTVFHSDTDHLKFRHNCYHVDMLLPLLLPDGTPARDDLFTESLLQEYRSLTEG